MFHNYVDEAILALVRSALCNKEKKENRKTIISILTR